jgi:hypothetical protein
LIIAGSKVTDYLPIFRQLKATHDILFACPVSRFACPVSRGDIHRKAIDKRFLLLIGAIRVGE